MDKRSRGRARLSSAGMGRVPFRRLTVPSTVRGWEYRVHAGCPPPVAEEADSVALGLRIHARRGLHVVEGLQHLLLRFAPPHLQARELQRGLEGRHLDREITADALDLLIALPAPLTERQGLPQGDAHVRVL